MVLTSTSLAHAQKRLPPRRVEVSFPSEDGLLVTADVYPPMYGGGDIVYVLFHQAGWSRGEYLGFAQRLQYQRKAAIAVDLRSGGKVHATVNKTHQRAVRAKKQTRYIDAMQDMRAAMRFARKRFPKAGFFVVVGSSYSAALALVLAGQDPKFADTVIVFSPGEYFSKFGKPKNWVKTHATKIKVPVFIAAARSEATQSKRIFDAIPADFKRLFIPKTKGNHGSRAMWRKYKDSSRYRGALDDFEMELGRRNAR
jgi:dienelactone hydrolase